MIESNKFDTERLKNKLSQMARAFPDYELDDIRRLDNLLITNSTINQFTHKHFFAQIDTTDQRYLITLGSICLQYSFINLAESLLKFCLMEDVIAGEISETTKLAEIIIIFVTRYEFYQYIDIERQSQRIRFICGSNYFAIHLTHIDEIYRIQILKLLHNAYVQKILESTVVGEIFLEKYDNILSLIRALDVKQLQKNRWSRLFLIPDLKYSPKASQILFNKIDGAPEFDEMVLRNFGILLLPAFGMTNFSDQKIEITNEGNGAFSNPLLEIRVNEEVFVKQEILGNVSAGELAVFELNLKDIRRLSTLNPNMKTVTFCISFKKYGGKNFDLIRSIETTAILNWIRSQNVLLTEIYGGKDLFEIVKGFVKQIQHKVQEDNGYVSLTNLVEGKRILRSETEIQIALKDWLEPKCEKYNIELDREPLTGRGPLDFKFSIGSRIKCIMEVKLWHSQRLEHGLKTQLPIYLISERARFGIYAPILIDSTGHQEKLAELKNEVLTVNETNNVEIEVMDIRAWKLETASKAKEVGDKNRYQAD